MLYFDNVFCPPLGNTGRKYKPKEKHERETAIQFIIEVFRLWRDVF